MPDQELVTDLLARLEERGDLARYSSIHELMGVDHELREQLQASPELLKEVERSFVEPCSKHGK